MTIVHLTLWHAGVPARAFRRHRGLAVRTPAPPPLIHRLGAHAQQAGDLPRVQGFRDLDSPFLGEGSDGFGWARTADVLETEPQWGADGHMAVDRSATAVVVAGPASRQLAVARVVSAAP